MAASIPGAAALRRSVDVEGFACRCVGRWSLHSSQHRCGHPQGRYGRRRDQRADCSGQRGSFGAGGERATAAAAASRKAGAAIAEPVTADDIDRYDLVQDKSFMAARMVVDTGLNGLTMTEADAAAILRKQAGLSEGETRTELMRYACQLPGQALGYGFGARAIAAARARAQIALGKNFDIKLFHDSILRRGEIGQAGLDRIVDDLISQNGRQTDLRLEIARPHEDARAEVLRKYNNRRIADRGKICYVVTSI